MKAEAITEAAGAAADLLKSLASENRLMILCHLVEGERSVGELAALIGARDTVVSQHLAVLRRDGLVANRKDGQSVLYALADPVVMDLLAVLHAHFCAPGGSRRTP